MLKKSTKKISSAIFILFFSLLATAQIQYEKGYYIDNTNTKTECFIKNLDWKSNPDNISYKLNENSSIETATINDISKFEIYDTSIYIRANVEIEVNATTSNQLDYLEKLDVMKKLVFLKLLVEGKSNLYTYKDANSKLFYYESDDKNINLLEYKEFLNDNSQIVKNQNYKSQLWNNLKCDLIDLNRIRKLDYVESDMINFMTTFNTCANDLTYTFKEKKRNNDLNLSIRLGINFAKANFDSPGNNFSILTDFEFNQETSFRLGIELEYTLPFNNDKWAILLEPTYQYYKTEKTYNSTPNSTIERIVTSSVNYSSIELPIGIRHYSYLNPKSRLFINFSAILDLSFQSEIKYIERTYMSDTGSNLAIGLGYNYHNKYSIEARLSTKREILNKFATVSSEYSNMSIIFGFTIF